MVECLPSMLEAPSSIPSIVKQQTKDLIKVTAGGTMGHLLNNLQAFLFSKRMIFQMRTVLLTFPKLGQHNLIFLLLSICFMFFLFEFFL